MREREQPMRMTLSRERDDARDSALEIDVLAPGEPAKRLAISPIDDADHDPVEVDDVDTVDDLDEDEAVSMTAVIGTRLTPRPGRSERPRRMTMTPLREKGGA